MRAASNPDNGELWVATYAGSGGGTDEAQAVATSPDGSRVFVTGYAQGGRGNGYVTIAYDAGSGSAIWTRYGPAFDSLGRAIAVSPDGSKVFVSGQREVAPFDYRYSTLAFDAGTGRLLWNRLHNGPGKGADVALAVGVSPDGTRVFVTGQSKGAYSGLDYTTVAYDADTGAGLWSARYDGPGRGTDVARSLAVSRDGSEVFVTGWSTGASSGLDYATVAYDAATGAALWVQRLSGPGQFDDRALSVAVAPDGSSVVVTGSSYLTASGQDAVTVAYDAATGNARWVRRYNGPASGIDLTDSVTIGPDGTKAFVTGYTFSGFRSGTAYDWVTLAYDMATGTPLWLRRYAGPSSERAYAVAVSPDGTRVFVTGSTTSAATVAYDATTGSLLWARSYHGPNDIYDDSYAIAVSPDGSKVFVTGWRLEVGTYDYDYLTVAYPA
ncbi:MAG TPA: PQQ-binding-like beta-propeller repeat protein [Actinomycetota bacterium]|nr:PQQ-binding-like beta-propeller repeat protein [Actinomycetota bacterium]